MVVTGSCLSLRDEPRDGDDEDLFRWLNLEEWSYYDEPDQPFRPVSRDEFERRLEARRRNSRPTVATSHTWHVDTAEGRHIGWVSYYGLEEQRGHAHVGIDLPDPESWGRGYGSEALALLVDHLFHEKGLQEVRTDTWSGNRRMMRLAEKCGFHEIGRGPHRAPLSVRGEPLEMVHFAMSRGEWLVRT